MRYLYTRSLFPVCWWFILTLWIFRNSDKEGAGLKKIMYLHSTDAVLGLWILHVLLGCSERWLETALMQCHTAVQCQFYGRWAVSRALLTIMSGVNTACCMLSDISTSCCCPNSCCWFWSMWDLCVKWKATFTWVCAQWAVWTAGMRSCWNQPSPQPPTTAYGKGRGCLTVHPHWHFAYGPWCYCLGCSTNAVWWAPFWYLFIKL